MAKSIVVTLRVKPWAMAKALDGLWQYNKAYGPESLAEIVRRTFEHGANYLNAALPLDPSKRAMQTIDSMTMQGKRRRNLDEQIIGTDLRFFKHEKELTQGVREDQLRLMEEALEPYKRRMKQQKRASELEALIKDADSRPSSTGPNPLTEEIDTGSEKSVVTDFDPRGLMEDLDQGLDLKDANEDPKD